RMRSGLRGCEAMALLTPRMRGPRCDSARATVKYCADATPLTPHHDRRKHTRGWRDTLDGLPPWTEVMRPPSLLMLCAVTLAVAPLGAQSAAPRAGPLDARFLSPLVWRNVGPFRGGRVSAVSGVIGQPGVFYAGTPAGGVWKTNSAGETWFPVFDSIRTVSSIGALEVAPSDPNVIYVGTGDLDSYFDGMGDGMYRSSDAGRTWRRIGLEGTEQIPAILVDPHDPNIVMVAALGRFGTPGDARGVFRSSDGGATWTKTLYVDDQTGVATLARAADAPDVVFAAAYLHYVAPGAIWPVPDTARMRTRLYKSTDGGKSFTGFKGGPPGGDDPQVMWIDPTNGKRMLMGYDQGAIVSFDGGDTWSSWYNQSTEQVYHIATDNSFPYWIYATQQDAG